MATSMTKNMIATSDLRKLDVINLEEGSYLGNVCDVDLDQFSHRRTAKAFYVMAYKVGRPGNTLERCGLGGHRCSISEKQNMA